jgi:hypothetical protein
MLTVADVIGLMGVVIGFTLALGWDIWQDYRHVKAELHRAARSIEQELSTDLALLSTDLGLLSEDTKAADGQREVVQPLELLSTAAGETAYLRGSLEADSVELTIKLRTVYSSISILNRRIEHREAYRLTNGAKTNYHGRRKLINQDLKQLIEENRNGINAFLTALKARHLA